MAPMFTLLRRTCILMPTIGMLSGMSVACGGDDDDDIVNVPTPIVRTVRDQTFNFAAQRLVGATLPCDVSGPLFRFQGQRRFEYAANPLPSFRLHHASPRFNS